MPFLVSENTLRQAEILIAISRKMQKGPSFFKILLGDFASVLRLPPLFVEIFGEKLSKRPSLVTTPGLSWAVKVNKNGDDYVFADGWSDFVRDNRLAAGDFVVFLLMDNYSTFQVQLYDSTCCDKQLSSSRFFPGFAGEEGGTSRKPVLTSRKPDLIPRHPDQTSRKPDLTSRKPDLNAKVKQESKDDDESDRSIGPSTENGNLSFVVVLPTKWDDKMIIPKSFVEKSRFAGKRSIKLVDLKGRPWEIKLRNQSGNTIMCAEWRDFWKANNLCRGYVCSFELVGSSDDQHLQFHLEKRAKGRPYGTLKKKKKKKEKKLTMMTRVKDMHKRLFE